MNSHRSAAGSRRGQSSVCPDDGDRWQHQQHDSERSESRPDGAGPEHFGPGGSAQQEAAQGGLFLPQLQGRRGEVKECNVRVLKLGTQRDSTRGLKGVAFFLFVLFLSSMDTCLHHGKKVIAAFYLNLLVYVSPFGLFFFEFIYHDFFLCKI